jgi:hypothetical protein
MVITENSNPRQMEREKVGSDEEKTKGIPAEKAHREFAYHAAQFHDQSRISNRNHANAVFEAFPSPDGTGEGGPHAKRVRFAHPTVRRNSATARVP